MEENNLLTVSNLHTAFRIDGSYYDAVDGVSFTVRPNEMLAIVGESGCGKSTVAMSIMGLHDMRFTQVSGEITLGGKNLLTLSESEMNKIRGKDIGFIFQDPLASLNPLQRVGKQIEEALLYHTNLTEAERQERVLQLLNDVGIQNPKRTAQRFPHELSGGMRQRVLIATALSCSPSLIIADEPTTALDVTIQAQILDLIKDLQEEHKAGIILITHDLGVVAQVADRVAVMYAGQIVELADARVLFTEPLHPYTRSLLKSIPQTDRDDDMLHVIKGMVPSLKNLKHSGCRFADRIPWIAASEHEETPELHEISAGHFVRCSCWKNFRFERDLY